MIGCYIRVSSRQQRDESDSPANQEARLRGAGAEVIYRDLAVSGYRLDKRRDATDFQRLLVDVQAGRLTRLLCTRLDRIARRDVIVLELAELCERHGVEFVSLGSGTVDTGSASGWLSVKMQLLIGEHFSRALSENIGAAYRAGWARGKAVRGPLPWHLQRDPAVPAHEHQFIKGPHWAVARQAVEMVLDGAATAGVAAFLRAQGVGPTSRSGVLNWLRNPMLRGHAGEWRGEGLRLLNVAPPLVSEAEFDQITARLTANRCRWGANAAPTVTIRALSGICQCSRCGSPLVQNRTGRRPRKDGSTGPEYWFLRCRHDPCPSVQRGWSMDAIERVLVEEHLALEADRLARLFTRARIEQTRAKRASGPEAVALRQELRMRVKLPAEFRTPADDDRIAHLRAQLAVMDAGLRDQPRALPVSATFRRAYWQSPRLFLGQAVEKRNAIWRDLVEEARIDCAGKLVVSVRWRY